MSRPDPAPHWCHEACACTVADADQEGAPVTLGQLLGQLQTSAPDATLRPIWNPSGDLIAGGGLVRLQITNKGRRALAQADGEPK